MRWLIAVLLIVGLLVVGTASQGSLETHSACVLLSNGSIDSLTKEPIGDAECVPPCVPPPTTGLGQVTSCAN